MINGVAELGDDFGFWLLDFGLLELSGNIDFPLFPVPLIHLHSAMPY